MTHHKDSRYLWPEQRPTGRPRGQPDQHGRAFRSSLDDAERWTRRNVGSMIRLQRRLLNVAASELAAACGLTTNTLLAWEAGRKGMKVSRLKQIADALGIGISSLVES